MTYAILYAILQLIVTALLIARNSNKAPYERWSVGKDGHFDVYLIQ